MTTPYMSESAYRKQLAGCGYAPDKIEREVARHKRNGRLPSEETVTPLTGNRNDNCGDTSALWQASSKRLGFIQS
jgi:hypothetical protein